jgi:hypothetical protein
MSPVAFAVRILPHYSCSLSAMAALVALAGCGAPALGGDGGPPPDADAPEDAASVSDSAPPPDGGAPDGAIGHDGSTGDAAAPDGGPREARLIALDREGHIASIDVAAPWTVRATSDLGAPVSSARCRGDRCVIVHPSPGDAITIVDAIDLSVIETFSVERGADPRDVALIDERTAIVSQYARAELLEIDLVTGETVRLDLSVLADDDGIPEAAMLAHCDHRVYVQLRRIEHATGIPASSGAALAVIDLDREGSDRIIDADRATDGVQGVALERRPAFDMPVDCEAERLYVVEPVPLMEGNGSYQVVDLETLTTRDLGIPASAQLGGIEVVGPELYWLITHTEFGPGASSHLSLHGAEVPDTHNTFAADHVDDLALDRTEDLLFYPDPCVVTPANAGCEPGIHVFDAHTGAPASTDPIGLDFRPLEVAIAR